MSEQNTVTMLNPGATTDGLPATVTVNPDEALAPAGASFAADAPAAQAGVSSGPGTLAYAIARWHAAHADPDRLTPTARGLFSYVQSAARWKADAKRYGRWQVDGSRPWISEGSEAERCRRAFATADLLGIPVGVIVAAEEES